MSDARPPLPRFPGGPDPSAPVPRDAVDGVDLDAWARIGAELAEAPSERKHVLARARLDERRWAAIEQAWGLRLATALLQGDLALGRDYDDACTKARAALGPTDPTRPLDAYAAIVARIEAGTEPSDALAAAGIALGDWVRLQRAWTVRIASDPALAKAFRAMVAEARASRSA